MADVLDQNEIDALMGAVEDGQIAQGAPGSPTRVFARYSGIRPLGEVEVREYDFKRPERVSKDQMRALEALHEGFARNFGVSLSGFLRTIMEVKVAGIEQMTFSEFTGSLPNPTCFNLLACEPLEGNFCMEISPLIIYPVVDRLLGGSNADLFIPQRPLTAIEMRLVKKIIDRGTAALTEAWENVCRIDFQLKESESNPALVQIVAPNEVVIVVGFEMKMSGRAGTMSLCIPYTVIEPVVDKLSSQTWVSYRKGRYDKKLRHRVENRLEHAKLGVQAILADTTIKLSDLMNLQPGDVILTEKPAAAPLSLHVEGKRKFIGRLGQYRGNRAFQVQRHIRNKDRV